MIPTLRILTRKSKLGFGKWKDYTIQELLNLRKYLVLISAYYKLTSINYTQDILQELRITEQYKIKKPSSNKEKYYKFLNENGYKLPDLRKSVGSNIMKPSRRVLSKYELQRKNQGH